MIEKILTLPILVTAAILVMLFVLGWWIVIYLTYDFFFRRRK